MRPPLSALLPPFQVQIIASNPNYCQVEIAGTQIPSLNPPRQGEDQTKNDALCLSRNPTGAARPVYEGVRRYRGIIVPPLCRYTHSVLPITMRSPSRKGCGWTTRAPLT